MTDGQEQADAAEAPERSSLADLVDEPDLSAFAAHLSRAAWIKIAVLGALFVALNFWQFRLLVQAWLHEPNWAHGFAIPLFSLYLLYRRWDELRTVPKRACLWGLPILVFGILLMIVAFYPIGTYWLCQLSMVVMLMGLVLYQAGPGTTRLTWLPICYLSLAMPIPRMLYTRIATPLQELAAQSARLLLKLFGAQIDIMGSHLDITSVTGRFYELTVVEACSGVRSLIAYVALGVAWAYLENRPIWQRVVLVAAAVPIAMACNIARVAATCWMYVIDRPELGEGFMHSFMGLVMLIPAIAMFWLLGVLLSHMFIEEEVEDEPRRPKRNPQAPPRTEAVKP